MKTQGASPRRIGFFLPIQKGAERSLAGASVRPLRGSSTGNSERKSRMFPRAASTYTLKTAIPSPVSRFFRRIEKSNVKSKTRLKNVGSRADISHFSLTRGAPRPLWAIFHFHRGRGSAPKARSLAGHCFIDHMTAPIRKG